MTQAPLVKPGGLAFEESKQMILLILRPAETYPLGLRTPRAKGSASGIPALQALQMVPAPPFHCSSIYSYA